VIEQRASSEKGDADADPVEITGRLESSGRKLYLSSRGSAPWNFRSVGAHRMGPPFVTGCLPSLRFLSTFPHGHAVTVHSPRIDVIAEEALFIRGSCL